MCALAYGGGGHCPPPMFPSYVDTILIVCKICGLYPLSLIILILHSCCLNLLILRTLTLAIDSS